MKGCGWDLAEWPESLTANAKVAAVVGSITASSDIEESEGRQMKQCCWIKYKKICRWTFADFSWGKFFLIQYSMFVSPMIYATYKLNRNVFLNLEYDFVRDLIQISK